MSGTTGDWIPHQFRVLTVDDDPLTRDLTKAALEDAGYEVWSTGSGQEALATLEKRGLPHLALVDILMPEMTGLELCTKIQEFIDLPVILLTGLNDMKTEAESIRKVAEDYITKPIEVPVLLARVERLLRRIGDYSYTLEPRLEVDDRLAIEFARRRAFVDGREVELTPTETKILYILIRNAGHTVLTGYILGRLWPLEEVFEDALRTHVYRLRQKIETSSRRPKYILTRRGLGYMFPRRE